MMIEPLYVRVEEGGRPLRITAVAQSTNDQLVRISGAEAPNKMSRAWWFKDFELRLGNQDTAEAEVPAMSRSTYWLVVQVFRNNGQGWSRLKMRAMNDSGPLAVPQIGIPYEVSDGAQESPVSHPPAVTLSIEYR